MTTPRDESHPDETTLLELVACGRLPFVRDAASHAGRCRLCARTVADLLQIAAAMFESQPEATVSTVARRRAVEAADAFGEHDDEGRGSRVRLRRSRRARVRAASAARAGSG